MKSLFSISVLPLLFSQSSAISFLHITWVRNSPGGTPEISRCFAYLKVELKESQPTVAQIFIEPNEKGVWSAVYMIDAQLLDKKGKPKGKTINLRSSFLELVRVEDTDLGKKITEIPDEEVRTADTYKIYLKSNKSAIKQGFELLFRNGSSSGLLF